MVSALKSIQKKKKLSEDSKHLAKRSRYQVGLIEDSFNRFGKETGNFEDSEVLFEELRQLESEERNEAIAEVFQKYIDWNYEKEVGTPTITNYVSQLKKIFVHAKVRFDVYQLKTELKFKRAVKEELYALQMEDIQKIMTHANPNKVSFYHALLSTGCRPGELLQVRKKDIDFSQDRPLIKIRAITTKTKTERFVWLTEESTELLHERLRGINEDDLVWGKPNTTYSVSNEGTLFKRVLVRAGLAQNYDTVNRGHITMYSFRSFFFTMCANVHSEIYAHKMIGHGGYLPQYYRMSDEEKLEKFLKVEPLLTVNQSKIVKELNKNNKGIESLLAENAELNKKIEKLEKIVFDNLMRD